MSVWRRQGPEPHTPAHVIPLPPTPFSFTWRRALFRAIAQSPVIAKIQYGLKISFIGIALLFADAVQSMMKLHREGAIAKESGVARDLRGENDFRARKFLSERNFYLTGFTLFLALILSRTYSLLLDLVKSQEDVAILKANSQPGDNSAALAQLAALQKEYDALAAQTQVVSDKKKD